MIVRARLGARSRYEKPVTVTVTETVTGKTGKEHGIRKRLAGSRFPFPEVPVTVNVTVTVTGLWVIYGDDRRPTVTQPLSAVPALRLLRDLLPLCRGQNSMHLDSGVDRLVCHPSERLDPLFHERMELLRVRGVRLPLPEQRRVDLLVPRPRLLGVGEEPSRHRSGSADRGSRRDRRARRSPGRSRGPPAGR